ncbi:MAG: glycosyltransferase family 4 protein [Armatimonadetes bacterium]|nr:glycosyltransferase family 4 protein [Armatimonadota bacterium]
MKIAMLGVKAVPHPGGICTYAEELGSRLVSRGHEVTVYCRRQYLNGAGDNGNIPPHRGIERKLSRGLRGKHLDALTHTFTSALDSLRRDYDVIHIHGSAPAVVAPLLRLRPGRPLVVTIHGLDWQGDKWGRIATRGMRFAASMPVRFAHELTVVSRGLRKFYRENLGREAAYIPTGVELPEILPPREIREMWNLDTDEYLLFVGRLTPEKGLQYLLSAYETLDTKKKLVIVGDANFKDPYVDDLRKRATDDVIFTGYRKGRTLAELFSNAYLYVQPSTLEAMPVAVLEALSYGRCVLATDIPGNVEALGECGYTFQVGNVDDLGSKLAMLLYDPDSVAAQYSVARDYVRREHNWETTTDQFEGLYRQVAGEDRKDVTSKSGVTAKVK